MYKNLAFCTTTNDVLLFCKFSLIGLPSAYLFLFENALHTPLFLFQNYNKRKT